MTRIVAPPAAPTFRPCGTLGRPSARLHIAQPIGSAAESRLSRDCLQTKELREGENKWTRTSPAPRDHKLTAAIPAKTREIGRRSRKVPAKLPSGRSVRLSCTLHNPPHPSTCRHHGHPRDYRRALVVRTRTACLPHIVGPPSIPASPGREISDRPSGSARIPDRCAGQEMLSPSPPHPEARFVPRCGRRSPPRTGGSSAGATPAKQRLSGLARPAKPACASLPAA